MSDNAAAFVGSIPEHYDRGLGPILFVDYAEEMARRVAAVGPHRVLETAAGTGIVTLSLQKALPSSTSLVATDLNPPMLDIARTKLPADAAIRFETADATALPFSDATFDAVVCQFGVMFFPDKDAGYREVFRVLEPGGRYFFSIWDSHEYSAFGRIAHATVGEFFPDNPPQFQKVPFSYTFDAAKASLIAAGFDGISAEVIRRRKIIPSAETFARGFVYGSPIIDQVRSRGNVDPDAIVKRLTEQFHAAFGADPGEMPLQAIFFSARKP